MNLKRLMIGTPLERPARIFHRLLTGGPHATSNIECELRDARDNAYVRALLRNKLKRDSNCIDVGAHSGFFLCQFIEFAPEGRHWAFEPIPALAAELKRNFPSVKVHECALSDQEGQTTFQYVPELPGWSGLRAQPYQFDYAGRADCIYQDRRRGRRARSLAWSCRNSSPPKPNRPIRVRKDTPFPL